MNSGKAGAEGLPQGIGQQKFNIWEIKYEGCHGKVISNL